MLVVTATKEPQRWDHVVARLRADRDAQTAYEAALVRIHDAGIQVLDEDNVPDDARRLSRLTDGDGHPLDPDGHMSCPGHVVVIDPYFPEQHEVFCVDPDANGHCDSWSQRANLSPARTGEDGKLSEEAKAERRAVIEGNRA